MVRVEIVAVRGRVQFLVAFVDFGKCDLFGLFQIRLVLGSSAHVSRHHGHPTIRLQEMLITVRRPHDMGHE